MRLTGSIARQHSPQLCTCCELQPLIYQHQTYLSPSYAIVCKMPNLPKLNAAEHHKQKNVSENDPKNVPEILRMFMS